MFDLGPDQLVLASLVMAVAATVQASVGFGMALLAVPFLILIDPRLVPAPTIIAGLTLTTLIAARERASMDLAQVRWILVGRVPGTVVGVSALVVLSEQSLKTLFGVLILLAVFLSAIGMKFRARPPLMLAAGVASGVMGTVAAIGGPPVALCLQHVSGPQLRGTMAGYFVISALLSLTGLALSGHLDATRMALGLWLVPAVVLGFFASSRTRSLLDGGHTRRAILVLSAVAALGVLLR